MNHQTSDTPETDALYKNDYRPNLMEHARKLERERDQWVAKAAELSAERDEARNQLSEERQLHVQTLDERDEVRASLAAAEAWSATLADVGDDFRATNAELRNAIRNMRDVRGDRYTQIATERLFALLPEASSQPES